MRCLYIDSSAAFKLVASEPESAALDALVHDMPALAASRLTRVEVARAARRTMDRAQLESALPNLWKRLTVLEISEAVLTSAEMIGPPLLRSLDAIQLATALSLGEDLAGVVAYDRRLLDAAAALGLQTWSPR